MAMRFSAGLWIFAASADKYGGYSETLSVPEQIVAAARVPGLEGLELITPNHVSRADVQEVRARLEAVGLEPISVNPNLWTGSKWQQGAFTSPNPKLRREGIDLAKQAIDIGHILGTRKMCLWPGQDGFDYPGQADYAQLWEWEAEGIREVAEYDPETLIGIEYKPREPRMHQLVSNAAKVALLGQELNLKNVGAYLDFGHALMTQENPAEALMLLSRHKRLFGVHVNDCYGMWDDDLSVGTIRLWEMLEFLLALKQVNYEGWISLDITPHREDPVELSTLSLRTLERLLQVVDKTDLAALRRAQHDGKTVETLRIMQEAILGGNITFYNV